MSIHAKHEKHMATLLPISAHSYLFFGFHDSKKSEPAFENQISHKNLHVQLLLKNEKAVLGPVLEGHQPTMAHRLWSAL